jgi:phosphoglucomutase
MIFPMAKKAKMAVKEVLTGFKFIGEQIGLLEKEGHPERFFFGFEESYGYLSDTGVRDKDAVDASLIIAQMMQYYKSIKKDPLERLEELYQEFGYSRSALDTFEFTGPVGAKKMAEIMAKLHEDAKGNTTYEFINDYLAQKHYEKGQVTPIDLPSSDVLKFGYADGSTITIRPSGTEPKLKVYYYVVTPKEKELAAKLVSYQTEIKNILKDYL